jgi:hypothetical protein
VTLYDFSLAADLDLFLPAEDGFFLLSYIIFKSLAEAGLAGSPGEENQYETITSTRIPMFVRG